MFKKTILAAMGAVAVVGSAAAIASPAAAGSYFAGGYPSDYPAQRQVDYWQEHVAWCFDNYRTYRASDNSFQPYQGSRALCFSPYWRG